MSHLGIYVYVFKHGKAMCVILNALQYTITVTYRLGHITPTHTLLRTVFQLTTNGTYRPCVSDVLWVLSVPIYMHNSIAKHGGLSSEQKPLPCFGGDQKTRECCLSTEVTKERKYVISCINNEAKSVPPREQ